MHTTRASLHTTRRHAAAFTLIELMIAVAIIGILVKLAYPAYTQSVLKSHRAEAKSALLDLASREERYFSTTNTFTASAPQLGYAAGSSWPLTVQAGSSSYYTLSVTLDSTVSAPNFTATATAVNSQVKDTKCMNFTLTQAGVQTVSGTDSAANCW